jgi:hypothetical protein
MDDWNFNNPKEMQNDIIDRVTRENQLAEEQAKETGIPSMRGLMDWIKQTNK